MELTKVFLSAELADNHESKICSQKKFFRVAGVFSCLFILSLLWAAPASAASPAEIQAKYRNARSLHENGEFESAVRAYKEIKVLQYHPILDYRIGECYEELNQYRLAIAAYELYIKYYGKFTPGKNHPTEENAKARVKKLKLKLETPYHPDLKKKPEHRDPYGAPEFDGPPEDRTHKDTFPLWRAMHFGVDLGYSSLSSGDFAHLTGQGVGIGLWAHYRPLLYLSVGVSGFFNSFVGATGDVKGRPSLGAVGLDVRGHLPFMNYGTSGGRFELWGNVFGGFSGFQIETKPILDIGNRTIKYTAAGGALGAGVGLEWFSTGFLSFGFSMKILKPILRTTSEHETRFDDLEGEFDRIFRFQPDENPNMGFLWYIGFSGTIHLYFPKDGRHTPPPPPEPHGHD